MSLEDSISSLAEAINNLANAINNQPMPQPQIAVQTEPRAPRVPAYPTAVSSETGKRRGRPPKNALPAVAEAAPTDEGSDEDDIPDFSQSEPAAPAAPTVEPEPSYTIDDLRKALMQLRDFDKGDKTRAVQVMKQVAACEIVPEVPVAHYGEIIRRCRELAA